MHRHVKTDRIINKRFKNNVKQQLVNNKIKKKNDTVFNAF
jgi:hypothetical protein